MPSGNLVKPRDIGRLLASSLSCGFNMHHSYTHDSVFTFAAYYASPRRCRESAPFAREISLAKYATAQGSATLKLATMPGHRGQRRSPRAHAREHTAQPQNRSVRRVVMGLSAADALKPEYYQMWWHAMFGITLPVAAVLMRSGACRCSATGSGCRCAPATLQLPWAAVPSVVVTQLRIFPQLTVSRRKRPGLSTPRYLLRRCDVVNQHSTIAGNGTLPYAAAWARGALARGAGSYFAACRKERPWSDARRLLGWAAGLDVHAPRPKRVLAILRAYNASRSCSALHPHRCVHLEVTSPKYAAIASEFARVGWRMDAATLEPPTSLVTQLRTIARARIILYSHGSAHANFIFARPLTAFVELTPYLRAPRPLARYAHEHGCQEAGATCAQAALRRQWVKAGRAHGQDIASILTAEGVPAAHAAVPIAPATGLPLRSRSSLLACDDWGCLSGRKLVRIALATYEKAARGERASRWVLGSRRGRHAPRQAP